MIACDTRGRALSNERSMERRWIAVFTAGSHYRRGYGISHCYPARLRVAFQGTI